jgi:hypothetical protein
MRAKTKKSVVTKKSPLKKRRKFLGEANGGALYVVAIIGIVALFGGVLAGGAVPEITKLATPPAPGDLYTCCDTGDGSACKPILEKQIPYQGQAYALLKSNIYQGESGHIVPTNDYTADGYRIFLNQSDKTANYSGKWPGCENGKDLIGVDTKKNGGRPCVGLPNDELIYICKDTATQCSKQVNWDTIPFDVYYRISDGPVIPEIASYCPKPKAVVSQGPQKVVANVTPDGKQRLQLETFKVEQKQTKSEWLGAWCKPAIYLYPEQKTQVNVKVAPKGPFTLTIPSYPTSGWDVTAYPDGRIIDNSVDVEYPYLYWEASIADKYINEPKDGYVVTYNELPGLFNKVLPAVGLNAKESSEFSKYWLKALPQSNYYFVGVLPEREIDTLAPLSIQPKPDSVLRVTLFFKALDQKVSVNEPSLTGFERKGFTVTEWGAFFKADKAHEGFTCLM